MGGVPAVHSPRTLPEARPARDPSTTGRRPVRDPAATRPRPHGGPSLPNLVYALPKRNPSTTLTRPRRDPPDPKPLLHLADAPTALPPERAYTVTPNPSSSAQPVPNGSTSIQEPDYAHSNLP